MKFLVALCAFTLTLGYGLPSLSSEETHQKSNDAEALTCIPGEHKNCDEKADLHSSQGKGFNKDWTHKRLEQVAAILPEPQPNKELSKKPQKTNLVSPKFEALIQGPSAELKWTEVPGATNYHVQVSKDAGFNNQSMFVTDANWIEGTSLTIEGLEAGHKYFWRVAAVNKKNASMFNKSLFTFSAFETK